MLDVVQRHTYRGALFGGHLIRFFAPNEASLLDLAATLHVFATAANARQPEFRGYDIDIVSDLGGKISTSAGLPVDTKPLDLRKVDTFIIAGPGDGMATHISSDLAAWIREQCALAERVAAIGTGIFLLAQSGLLAGRRVTTHWAHSETLAKDYPELRVERDALYVTDGIYWTSAGMLASIDMALSMVEHDLGRRAADHIARCLIAKSRRSRGEPQISAELDALEPEGTRIRRLMEWIAENPRADLSTSALAEKVALSRRSLHRHFRKETKQTPAEFVERVRVAEARRLLARTDQSIENIAAASGFGSALSMRRAFLRLVETTPADYRKTVAA